MFYKEKARKDGLRSDCKSCVRARLQKSYADDRNKYRARVTKWEKRNPEKKKLSVKSSRKKGRDNLNDAYIKSLLVSGTSLIYSDLTPELVEAKRVQLLLARKSRKLKCL